MMLNGDDNDLVGSCFVDNAVRKTMCQAASSAIREWRPGVGIIFDAFNGLFDLVGEFETKSQALVVVILNGLFEFRCGGVKVRNPHLPRR